MFVEGKTKAKPSHTIKQHTAKLHQHLSEPTSRLHQFSPLVVFLCDYISSCFTSRLISSVFFLIVGPVLSL